MANKVKKQAVQGETSVKSELIRRFKANPAIFIGTVVVLIIVIVAFVFVPAFVPGAGGGSGTDLTFGVYDKTPIVYRPGNFFARAHEEATRRRQGTFNEGDSYFVNYQIWWEAYQSAVVRTGILQEMKDVGYAPPKDLVNREVA
ncbi:MAG: peptidylprolyl isomerase, partial [Treponema sp.]|nr:peptidylprolyl isomerase [Treponema sp.]